MNCKAYNELTIFEKREMIGKISHLIQNNEFVFDEIKVIITTAEDQGLLKGVNILEWTNPYKNIIR